MMGRKPKQSDNSEEQEFLPLEFREGSDDDLFDEEEKKDSTEAKASVDKVLPSIAHAPMANEDTPPEEESQDDPSRGGEEMTESGGDDFTDDDATDAPNEKHAGCSENHEEALDTDYSANTAAPADEDSANETGEVSSLSESEPSKIVMPASGETREMESGDSNPPEPESSSSFAVDSIREDDEKVEASSSANELNKESNVSSSPTRTKVEKKVENDIVSKIDIEKTTVGQALHDARVIKDWSVDQIEQKTKIKKNFIEAIERDDYKLLPAVVYINAYIKTLGELYGFNRADVESLIKSLKDERKHPHVPEELLHYMEQEKQINVQDMIKFKRMTNAVIAAVAAIVVIAAIIFFLVRRSNATEGGPVAPREASVAAPFDSSELEVFVIHRPLRMREFDVPSHSVGE